MPSVPHGKGGVRKAVGWCLSVLDGGISSLPCWPFKLVAVGAMCFVSAFGDGLFAWIEDTRET